MSEPVKVFLSYRRSDSQHVAGRFADRVAERFQLFMDIDTIPPGVDFTEYVRGAVSSCDVLLAFIGPHWADAADGQGRRRLDDPTDWVAEEIRTALARGVRVIPVLVDGATMPDPSQLPDSLAPLVARQSLPLRHASFSADAARLTTAIQDAGMHVDGAAGAFGAKWEAAPPPTPVQVVLAAPDHPKRRRRLLLWLSIAVLVALLSTVGVLAWRRVGEAASATGGSVGGEGSTSATTSSRIPSKITTLGELREHVPAFLRAGCRELVPDDEVLRKQLQVAMQCTPPSGTASPHYVFYFAYRDSAAAAEAFRRYYDSAALPPGDCRRSEGQAAYEKQGGRPATGTLLCYTDPSGLQVIAWTNEQLAVVASAADQDLGYSRLRSWWEQAGPLVGDR